MILQQISEEELARIYIAIEPYIPQIEKRTGIRRKVIVETLIVSDYLLRRAADTPETAELSLDEFINRHCRRVAAEVDLSVYDAMNIFTTRTEVMLEA